MANNYVSNVTVGGNEIDVSARRVKNKDGEVLEIIAGSGENHGVTGDVIKSVTGNVSETVGGDKTVGVTGKNKVTAGSEEIIVKGDATETVGGDKTVGVTGKNKVTAGSEEIIVKGDATETVGGDKTVGVTGNEAVNVGGDRQDTVDGSAIYNNHGYTNNVYGDCAIGVSGNSTETVNKNKTVDVLGDITVDGKTATVEVSGNYTESVGGDKGVTVQGNQTDTVVGSKADTVSKGYTFNSASANITVDSVLTKNVGGENVTNSGNKTESVNGVNTVLGNQLYVATDNPIKYSKPYALDNNFNAVDMLDSDGNKYQLLTFKKKITTKRHYVALGDSYYLGGAGTEFTGVGWFDQLINYMGLTADDYDRATLDDELLNGGVSLPAFWASTGGHKSFLDILKSLVGHMSANNIAETTDVLVFGGYNEIFGNDASNTLQGMIDFMSYCRTTFGNQVRVWTGAIGTTTNITNMSTLTTLYNGSYFKATELGFNYIADCYKALCRRSYFLADSIHPTEAGYKAIAKVIACALVGVNYKDVSPLGSITFELGSCSAGGTAFTASMYDTGVKSFANIIDGHFHNTNAYLGIYNFSTTINATSINIDIVFTGDMIIGREIYQLKENANIAMCEVDGVLKPMPAYITSEVGTNGVILRFTVNNAKAETLTSIYLTIPDKIWLYTAL